MTANPQQQAAIDAPAMGRVQVKALAGTGKSWMLRERAIRLLSLPIDDDTPPWADDARPALAAQVPRAASVTELGGGVSLLDQLLATTVSVVQCNGKKLLLIAFNKKIQTEMQAKFRDSPVSKHVTVMTSHAFALSLLKQFPQETALLIDAPSFEVVTKDWQLEKMAGEVLAQHGVALAKRDLSAVVKALVAVGNLQRSCDEATFNRLVVRYQKPLKAFIKARGNVRQLAQAIYLDRYHRGLLSFSDMIPLACQLPAACFANLGYAYLMVDEVQDFNMIQHQLIEKIGAYTEGITMVGDIFQTIYRFTGAVPEVFDRIPELHGASVYRLEGNYRSSPAILGFANAVLRDLLHSDMQLTAKRTDLDDAPKPWVLPPGQTAAQWIMGVHTKFGIPLSDIAVLYRANKQCLYLELDLLAAHVPYQAKTGGFLSLAVVKDLLSYLLMVLRPAGEWWETVVGHRKYLGKETAQASWNAVAFTADKRPWRNMPETLRNQGQRQAWRELGEELEQLRLDVTEGLVTPATLIMQLHSRLGPYWQERYADDPDALDDAMDVAMAVMAWISGMTDVYELVEVLDARDRLDAANGVALMTLHKAKGLEFEATLLFGCGDKTFVRVHPNTTEDDLQDEWRLYYVGITRGKRIFAVHADPADPVGGLPGAMLRSMVYGVAPDHVAGDARRDPLGFHAV